MEQYETITCSERSPARLVPAIILACIGIPHLLIGVSFLVLGAGDADMPVIGAVFSFSGTVLLAIALPFFAGWLNRKVEATQDGIVITSRFGRTTFFPWEQVSVTDHVSDSRRLEFHVPGRSVSFSSGCKGYEDMRSHLRSRGLLLDKAGRRKTARSSGDEIVDVKKLV